MCGVNAASWAGFRSTLALPDRPWRTNRLLAHFPRRRGVPMPVARHVAPAMPLLRLLAVNCAAGVAVAMLAVGGLLAFNKRLRDLIFSDQAPGIALVLLEDSS